jgi:hypothetical protein
MNWCLRGHMESLPEETIQYLFLDYYYARFIWRLTHITFGITQPQSIQHMFGSQTSIQHMFGSRTNQVGGKLKRQLHATTYAFCWVI